MVGHEQRMVELEVRVVAAAESALAIGFVGDGQIQAEDARVVHLLIDIEATVPVRSFVEGHRCLHPGNAGEQKGRPAVLVREDACVADVLPK
jgi:hypothetical protein